MNTYLISCPLNSVTVLQVSYLNPYPPGDLKIKVVKKKKYQRSKWKAILKLLAIMSKVTKATTQTATGADTSEKRLQDLFDEVTTIDVFLYNSYWLLMSV